MSRQEVLWTMLILMIRQSSTFRFEMKDDNRYYRPTGRAIDGSPSKIQHLKSFYIQTPMGIGKKNEFPVIQDNKSFYIQTPMGISKKNEFPVVQNKKYNEHSSPSAMNSNSKYIFPTSQYDKHHIETKLRETNSRNNDATQNEYKKINDTFLLSIQEGQPPIKFYSINCNEKASCSSIIPAPDFSASTSKPKFRTIDETKNYLRSFNLQDGFRFSKSPTEDLVSKMFKAERKSRENKRRSRQMKFKDIRDSPGFWPGSQYRPKVVNAREDRSYAMSFSNLMSPREKYNHQFEQDNKLSYLLRNNIRNNIPTKPKSLKTPIGYSKPNRDIRIAYSKPNRDTRIAYSKPNRDTPIPYSKPNRDGEWRRYSKATVSKLDTETGEWNRVSRSYKPSSVQTGNEGGTTHGNQRRPIFYHKPMHGNKNIQKHSTESSGIFLTEIDFIRNNVNVDIPVNPRDPTNLSQLLIDSSEVTTTSTTTIPTTTTILTTTTNVPIALRQSQTISPISQNDDTANSTETLQTTGMTSTSTTTQKSVFRNPQAMAAAVGAGLIPATFAAVLPVMFGRRRRRRSIDGHDVDRLNAIFRMN